MAIFITTDTHWAARLTVSEERQQCRRWSFSRGERNVDSIAVSLFGNMIDVQKILLDFFLSFKILIGHLNQQCTVLCEIIIVIWTIFGLKYGCSGLLNNILPNKGFLCHFCIKYFPSLFLLMNSFLWIIQVMCTKLVPSVYCNTYIYSIEDSRCYSGQKISVLFWPGNNQITWSHQARLPARMPSSNLTLIMIWTLDMVDYT